MKRAAFLTLAALQLVAIGVVYAVAMPMLLGARGLIVVCTEATRRPIRAALLIGLLAWATWFWTTWSLT
jgi:hypothetical protein